MDNHPNFLNFHGTYWGTQDRKTIIKRQQNLSFWIICKNNHARNKRFQLPLIPTANQILWHCSNSQLALRPKSSRSEHKPVRLCIRPNFSGSR